MPKSKNEIPTLNFWDDELPIQMLGDEPEDKPSIGWTLFLWAVGLIAVCLIGSLLVPTK